MVQHYSNISWVLVRRVNLDLLGCPIFYRVVYLNHKLIQVYINLDKAKPNSTNY